MALIDAFPPLRCPQTGFVGPLYRGVAAPDEIADHFNNGRPDAFISYTPEMIVSL